jgi:hypothetical protein
MLSGQLIMPRRFWEYFVNNCFYCDELYLPLSFREPAFNNVIVDPASAASGEPEVMPPRWRPLQL